MSDDRAADEARMRAIFGRTGRLRPATAPRRVERPKDRPPPPGLADGPIELLDPDAEAAWRVNLPKEKRVQWDDLKAMLERAGPEMRWRAAGYVMRAELENARKCLRVAQNIENEPYKADLIRRNGKAFREKVEALESRLAGLYQFVLPLSSLISDVERAYWLVTDGHQMLTRVTSAWVDSWPGAARGRGIPGYDSPENVAKVRAEVRAAHERHVSQQTGKPETRKKAPKKRRTAPASTVADEQKRLL